MGVTQTPGNDPNKAGVVSRVRRAVVFLSLLLTLVLVGACTSEQGSSGTVLAPDTTEAPAEYTGRSYAGTDPAPEFPDGLDWLNVDAPLSIAALRGKVVLLDFWTYGCINCIHIIPDLERLEAEYAEELVVIGVHSAKFTNEGDTDNIRNVIARYGLEHPVVNDSDFAVWDRWGVNAWPTVVLIDPAGNIVGGHAGEGIYGIFQPAIDALVEEFEFLGLLDRQPLDLSLPAAGASVLSFPGKVYADSTGERLFVADTNHHRVLVVEAATGQVLDVAGSGAPGFGDGDFDTARFDQPQGMALSADGNTLYLADLGNHAVRALDLAARTVTTLAGTGEQSPVYPPRDGEAATVVLSSPWDLLLVDDSLYVAMAGSHQLWVIDLVAGTAEAVAGSGAEGVGEGDALDVALAQPSGLAVDEAGNLYWADSESSSIRVLRPDGTVGLVAGSDSGLFDFGLQDGNGADALFQHPLGVAFDAGVLYVADTYNSVIRAIDISTGAVRILTGGDPGWQDGIAPRFNEPGGIAFAAGRLFVADTNNHAVRVVDPATGEASTLVLYGIEQYLPPVEPGAVITLDAVVAAPGEHQVAIDVQLPDGYVLNDLAPLVIQWSGGVEPGEYRAVAPASPISVTLSGLTGAVRIDVTVYYCEATAKELCLIDRAAYEIPFTVAAGRASHSALEHTVLLPAG